MWGWKEEVTLELVFATFGIFVKSMFIVSKKINERCQEIATVMRLG